MKKVEGDRSDIIENNEKVDIEIQRVSHSKLGAYKRCPYMHKLRYIDKIEPIRIQKPLYKGSGIHSLVEMRARNKMDPENNVTWQQYLDTTLSEAYDQLSSQDKEDIGDFISDAKKIMLQYDWAYSEENIKYLEVEKWVEFDLIRGRKKIMRMVGKVDAIVEIAGKQYIVEHKTFSSQPMSLGDSWINIQTSIYAYVLNKYYGYNIVGVLWDMIKSEPPAAPNILKNGSYGKQSGKVTLMSFTEYPGEEIIEQVKDNHLNFLNRFITPLVPSAVEIFMKDTKDLARMMYYQGDKMLSHRNLTRDCTWCSYRDICQTELTGGDATYIREMLYRSREEQENVVQSTETE